MILFILSLPVALYLTYALIFPRTKGQLKPIEIPTYKEQSGQPGK
ncbi:hypothetical protein [Lentiprolixibacter aurantiacus]|uniref:Uncharacterized protein n=1 Tax=Lentiprolixibacter aurantiacus TaxID=2993939 RepID=A0AAE3MLT7_9FLAO|nr:hypothetical protein [Lentiprolixibacter aurantiacus]MCX2720056.1 hypothetical protein [Lentiprolixibacter aurantiacus]